MKNRIEKDLLKKGVVFTYFLLFVVLLNSGCKTKEKLVYFQSKSSSDSLVSKIYTPVYKVNDFLSITVFGSDPEAVKPFNLPVVAYPQSDGRVSGTPVQQGFFVDEMGNIALPIVGVIKIAGLSRDAATQLVQEKLSPFIKDPIVSIRIMNFKVTVLGEVKIPGQIQAVNERLSLLEAIGAAGDLLITGERKNVLVIRENNGLKTEFRVDLTSKDLLSHPAYYLEQNDIVYVEPNSTKRKASVIGPGTSIVIAFSSLVITTISILTR
jgi:polysaccharide export outer membrane protein